MNVLPVVQLRGHVPPNYFEITLDLERNTNKSKKIDLRTHHSSNTIAHARIGHYAAPDDQYYLIEELQSDMLQKNSYVKDLPLKKNKDYEIEDVILLQPTSPLRKYSDIQKAYKIYKKKNYLA